MNVACKVPSESGTGDMVDKVIKEMKLQEKKPAQASEESKDAENQPKLKSLAVFGSTENNKNIDEKYQETATVLGFELARRDISLVCSTDRGLAGICAQACSEPGGQITLCVQGSATEAQTQFAEDILESNSDLDHKKDIEQNSDGFVFLPGGIEIIDRLFELVDGKYLRYHSKPIAVVNDNGFYNSLMAILQNGIKRKFMREEAITGMFQLVNNPKVALDVLENGLAHAYEQNKDDCLAEYGTNCWEGGNGADFIAYQLVKDWEEKGDSPWLNQDFTRMGVHCQMCEGDLRAHVILLS